MKPEKLIGIYSPVPRSGKSTIYSILKDTHGYERVAFAGPLKELAASLLELVGVPKETAHNMVHEDKERQVPGLPDGVTPRYILQQLATDFGRDKIDPELWVKAWLSAVEKTCENHPKIVVDDVRFENEAEAVRSLGGQLWKVVRPSQVELTQMQRLRVYLGGLLKKVGLTSLSLKLTRLGMHKSEGGLEHINFDVVIVNDGSIDDLKNKVIEALQNSCESQMERTILS